MIDLPTTRRDLRQRLAVHRVDGCMPVPTATLTALLDALDAAGLSWPAIGRRVGRHRSTVSMIARGVSPTISAELAAAILALEVAAA